MIEEPKNPRVIAFVDGQNLFHAAKAAFGYTYPNYDLKALSREICRAHDWTLQQVRFYTGIPSAEDDSKWNQFWVRKMAQMGRQKVYCYSRSLRYRNQVVSLPDGSQHTYLSAHEKGIDIRIALDIVSLALDNAYDVALLFSQDQDLSEVADEIRRISGREGRWIKMASAYPSSPAATNTRGVNKTDWIRIDRETYDRCLDPRDYR